MKLYFLRTAQYSGKMNSNSPSPSFNAVQLCCNISILYRLSWRHATIHFPDQDQSVSFNLLNVSNRRHFPHSPNSLRFEELLLLPAISELGQDDYPVGIVRYTWKSNLWPDRSGALVRPAQVCDEKSPVGTAKKEELFIEESSFWSLPRESKTITVKFV